MDERAATPPPFWVERRPAPDGMGLVALGGEFDLATSGRFAEVLETVRADRPRVVVADFTEVSFIDSTMLRELLRAHRELTGEGSRLVLAAPQASVRRLLDLTGTATLLEVVDEVAAAFAARAADIPPAAD